jgi:hypothetical protein
MIRPLPKVRPIISPLSILPRFKRLPKRTADDPCSCFSLPKRRHHAYRRPGESDVYSRMEVGKICQIDVPARLKEIGKKQ